MARLNKRSVPFNSLVFTTAGIIFCIITGLIPALANTLNVWMWAVAGLIGVIVWILIGVCVIIFRVRLAREGKDPSELAYRSPGYPWVPILTILTNTAVLVSMLSSPDQRLSLYIGLPVVIATFAFFFWWEKKKKLEATVGID